MNTESERVDKELIPKAIEALRALDAPIMPDVPAIAAIRAMRRQIERVLRLGYSYDEVSDVLKGLGVNISANRIEVLLAQIKKPPAKKEDGRESRVPKGSTAATGDSKSSPAKVNDVSTRSQGNAKSRQSSSSKKPASRDDVHAKPKNDGRSTTRRSRKSPK